MIIETTRFGDIEMKEQDIITFEKGIPGFEEEHQFVILQPDPENPLAFLQSTKTKELAFVITNPFYHFQDYEFELDENTKQELEIKQLEDVTVWGIMSIPEDFDKATINLQAPVIVNVNNKKGKQIILNNSPYLTKTPMFPQLVKEGGK